MPVTQPGMSVGKKVLLSIVAILVIAALLLITSTAHSLPGEIIPSCTVGVNGAAANVTFNGSNAGWDCDSMVDGANQRYYSDTGGAMYYHYEGDPTGSEICSGQFGSDTFVVRDTGTFMMAGGQLCQYLENSK